MNTLLKPITEIDAIIAERVYEIEQGHASNLIEGIDVGEDALMELLNLAREPIDNEEFTTLALAAVHRRHKLNV